MTNSDTKLYELAYIVTPDLKDEEALAHTQKIKDLVTAQAGEVNKEETPRKRRLAYPLKHKTQGYFGYFHVALPTEGLSGLKTKLVLDTNILRHLLITVDKKQLAQMRKPMQSAAAQERMKKLVPAKEQIEQAIFKEGAPQLEEKKVELEELDKKLEEILNKEV